MSVGAERQALRPAGADQASLHLAGSSVQQQDAVLGSERDGECRAVPGHGEAAGCPLEAPSLPYPPLLDVDFRYVAESAARYEKRPAVGRRREGPG